MKMSSVLGQNKEKDHAFTKKLLEASDKHNKNLNELILILKKNSEEEKMKIARLSKENGEIRRDLGSKQLTIKKLEKELQLCRQNEQKNQAIIKTLQESIEKYRPRERLKGDDIPNVTLALNMTNPASSQHSERSPSISSMKYNNSVCMMSTQGELREESLAQKKNSLPDGNTLEADQQRFNVYQQALGGLKVQAGSMLSQTLSSMNNSSKTKLTKSGSSNGVINDKENSCFQASKLSIDTNDTKKKSTYSTHHQPYSNSKSTTNYNSSQDYSLIMASKVPQTNQFFNDQISNNLKSPGSPSNECVLSPSTQSQKDVSSQYISTFSNSKSQLTNNNAHQTSVTIISPAAFSIGTGPNSSIGLQQNYRHHHSRYASESNLQRFNVNNISRQRQEGNIPIVSISQQPETEAYLMGSLLPQNQLKRLSTNINSQQLQYSSQTGYIPQQRHHVDQVKENSTRASAINHFNSVISIPSLNGLKTLLETGGPAQSYSKIQARDVDLQNSRNLLNTSIGEDQSGNGKTHLNGQSNMNQAIKVQKDDNQKNRIIYLDIQSPFERQGQSSQLTANCLNPKKRIEEEVKSPKLFQKDSMEQQFQKTSVLSSAINKNAFQHDAFSRIQDSGIGKRRNTTEVLSTGIGKNTLSQIQDEEKDSLIGQMKQNEKTIENTIKNDEDVTMSEDILDTIANVEEDADEAANLENLSGSHFKFTMKNSSKSLRRKTEQYFSKIENPSLTQINKKKFEYNQQIQQQLNIHQLSPLKPVHLTSDCDPKGEYELANCGGTSGFYQISYNNNNRNACPLNGKEFIYLNTEEASKSIYENHQSVEVYNQINNKMTEFKYQNLSNGTPERQENVLEHKIKNKYSIHEKKEPGKMKQQLEQTQVTEIGNCLFEGLMIYGPDKSEIKTLKSSSTQNINRYIAFK